MRGSQHYSISASQLSRRMIRRVSMPGGTMHALRNGSSPKVRATLYLSADILDEARNAAVHLAGFPARLTLAKLADNALRAELQRLKAQYNHGQNFPPRDA